MIAKHRKSSRFAVVLAAAVMLVCLLVFSSPANSETTEFGYNPSWQRDKEIQQLRVGEEFQPCEGCPTFVRVPEPPADSRRITHVAKFELTWNQYLVAYDAGVCPLPTDTGLENGMAQINPRGELFKGLRRDYPISNLGPSELDCYVAWLDAQTTGQVRLPSNSEWEWFARSGVADRKYPWGNEEDPRREALLREKVLDVIYGQKPKELIDTRLLFILRGTKVGLFPPTEWGLYDVMGNVPELTSDTIDASNINSYRQQLGMNIELQPGISRKRIIKGEALLLGAPEGWKEGISLVRFVVEINGRFSYTAGVRLVIEGE